MTYRSCPNCGTAVDEGATRCPACHADLTAETDTPSQPGRWCPGCGALVPEGTDTCPECGMPVGAGWSDASAAAEAIDSSVPPVDGVVSQETQAIPRIESALPIEPAELASGRGSDEMPQTTRVLAFVLAAALVVVGLSLAITHPWDPDAYSTKATTEADLSRVGFPGEVEALTSQDRSAIADTTAAEEPVSADEASYRALKAAWDELGAFRDALAVNEELMERLVTGAWNPDEAADGAADADGTALAISNTIAAVQEIDVTSGTYTEDREHVLTLGNWLRNWSDALCAAWSDDLVTSDDAAAFRTLFDGRYTTWEPQPPPKD